MLENPPPAAAPAAAVTVLWRTLAVAFGTGPLQWYSFSVFASVFPESFLLEADFTKLESRTLNAYVLVVCYMELTRLQTVFGWQSLTRNLAALFL